MATAKGFLKISEGAFVESPKRANAKRWRLFELEAGSACMEDADQTRKLLNTSNEWPAHLPLFFVNPSRRGIADDNAAQSRQDNQVG